MGASKNNFIEDAFFNSHFIDGGDNSCGSFETEEAMKRCYPISKPAIPPPLPFVKFTQHDKESWDYLKQTNSEKEMKEDKYLKSKGI